MERHQETKERLTHAVTALASSEGFRAWLRLRTRTGLGRYSLCNQLLIALQCPQATRVAGYRAWQKLGRQVRRGETAIWILAPLKRAFTVSDEDTGEDRTYTQLVGFRSEAVFDISQTTGPHVPSYQINPPGKDAAHLEPRLVSFAHELGLEVRTADLGLISGYFDSHRQEIVLTRGLTPNSRVHCLVHELVHAMGISYVEYGRRPAELITETATAIVCAELGLNAIEQSSFYLCCWADGDTTQVMAHLKAADEIARKLEAALRLRQEPSRDASAA